MAWAGGQVELTVPLPPGPLVNADLAPTPIARRTWNLWHIASLWVGMSVCIPTYMLAASMVGAGMTWRQSLVAILLGNVIVLLPMLVSGHAGTRYGIPFPVFARAAFGTIGAHVPSLLRSVVACGWFGIQTWVGGLAIHALIGILWPAWPALGGDWRFMGYGLPHFAAFLVFWLINMYFVWVGTDGIRVLETLAAPLLIAMGLALLAWAGTRAGGLGAVLAQADALERPAAAAGGRFVLSVFVPWVTAMVGFWATLSLNIPDFTRFARSQRDQAVGQTLGLLTTMPLFAFIGVAATSATLILYGEAIWNPVDLLARLTAESGNALLGIGALVAVLVATLTTNIAANVVAPANGFSALFPRHIGFRVGGLITGLIGIGIFPWRLLDRYQTWLIGYSGLLGAVAGVIVCDYVVIQRGRLALRDLYAADGRYRYAGGVNRRALLALAAGIATALIGLLHPALRFLFDGAWFSAAGVAGGLYWLLMRSERMPA
jgi:NCS1 family nucleobase:cation symporter-1